MKHNRHTTLCVRRSNVLEDALGEAARGNIDFSCNIVVDSTYDAIVR